MLQEDGLAIAYEKPLTVTFEPELPANVTSPTGTTAYTSPTTAIAEFSELVFYGVRGSTYTMYITIDPATSPLAANVTVDLCFQEQFVKDYTNCQNCPDGAACNGTEVAGGSAKRFGCFWDQPLCDNVRCML